MEINMRENGKMIIEKEMEFLYGNVGISMKEIGIKIKKMEKDFILDQMEINIMENGKMIKYKAKVVLNGLMVQPIMEIGKKINDMEKAHQSN